MSITINQAFGSVKLGSVLSHIEVLRYAACAVRHFGFVPATASTDESTKAKVTMMIKQPIGIYLPSVTEDDKTVAEACLVWGKGLVGQAWVTQNEYMSKLAGLFGAAGIAPHEIGVMVSAIPSFLRSMARQEAKASAINPAAKNEWFGAVGGKLTLSLTVTLCKAISTVYGTSHLLVMVDSDGRTFKWFASNCEAVVGKVLVLKGTVKAHDEYQGRYQTTLTRCKVQD